jgi:lipopolysaccharide biosynthesis glycosyltransferase
MESFMGIIPIVMAFDEKYAMPACVTVYSALRSKKEKTLYAFYFLVRTSMPIDVIEKFDKFVELYPGTEIEFAIVGERLDDAFISRHISKESYYRLLIPELFPKLDKCLYLDVDLIICDDLTELWNYEIGNNLLAGVKNKECGKKRYRAVGISSPDQYISAGVLIFNLKAIRDENLTSRFLKLVTQGYEYHDQDILNKECNKRIKYLPLKYNIPLCEITNNKLLKTNYLQSEIEDAISNPVIIHYIGREKPWNIHDDYAFLLHLWYQAALESPYQYDHIAQNILIGRHDNTLIQTASDARNTLSYKIGSIITFIPRVLMKLFKGLK